MALTEVQFLSKRCVLGWVRSTVAISCHGSEFTQPKLTFLTINLVCLTTAFQRRWWKSSAVLTHDRRTRAPSSYVTHVSAYEHRMRPRDGSKPAALVIYQGLN